MVSEGGASLLNVNASGRLSRIVLGRLHLVSLGWPGFQGLKELVSGCVLCSHGLSDGLWLAEGWQPEKDCSSLQVAGVASWILERLVARVIRSKTEQGDSGWNYW
jgi:hypothetical protein